MFSRPFFLNQFIIMKKVIAFLKNNVLLAFLFSTLENFVKNLPNKELAAYLTKRVMDIKRVVELMTDKNPENSRQLKEFYLENRELFLDEHLILSAKAVRENLEDKHLAELVATTLEELAEKDVFKPKEPTLFDAQEDEAALEVENKKGKKSQPVFVADAETVTAS